MKAAFVTGSSGDIGVKIVERLVKDGYFVVGQYNKDEVSAKELKEKFSGYFFPVKADLTDEKEISAAVGYFYDNFPRADVFIHCAGKDLYKLAQDTTEKEWDEIFAVNVKSAFLITKRFIPEMVKAKRGRIIFVTSVWGKAGACMESAYAASKSALKTYALSLAKELGPSGIMVNCVCPGAIDTPMNDIFDENEKRDICERTALGRLGRANEIADLVTFLASDRASFITGQTITADGCFNI